MKKHKNGDRLPLAVVVGVSCIESCPLIDDLPSRPTFKVQQIRYAAGVLVCVMATVWHVRQRQLTHPISEHNVYFAPTSVSIPPTYCSETRFQRDAIGLLIARVQCCCVHSHRKHLGILVRLIAGHVP
jgi:hypothetical protein